MAWRWYTTREKVVTCDVLVVNAAHGDVMEIRVVVLGPVGALDVSPNREIAEGWQPLKQRPLAQ